MSSMKGLLKGLRYISQIFDEKEEEMKIGFPTDVKHVAHIGMDGPSASTPSWMNEYKPEISSAPSNTEVKDKHATNPRDPLTSDISGPLDSPTRRTSSKTKHSRRHHSSSGSVGSPTRDSSGSNKPRRHKNSGDLDSPSRESSTRARRHHNSNLGLESPSQDPPGVPKSSRRKKSKDSSGGGSSISSGSKPPDPLAESFPYSDPGPRQGLKNNEMCPNPVLKVYEEGNECDEISRGIRAL